MIPYFVTRIPSKLARAYIIANHYTHGCHNGPSPCYGLYEGEALIGVLMFATPCSENVRSSIFGPEDKNSVIELHRLHILDVTPRNTESWFIVRCFRHLVLDRPHTRAVISFADATEGHHGTIYRAANALFYGMSGRAVFFRDQSGRLRHPRQNGVNVDGKALGWTPVRREGKYRYLWLLGTPSQRRASRKRLRVPTFPYPAPKEDA